MSGNTTDVSTGGDVGNVYTLLYLLVPMLFVQLAQTVLTVMGMLKSSSCCGGELVFKDSALKRSQEIKVNKPDV